MMPFKLQDLFQNRLAELEFDEGFGLLFVED